MRSCAVACRVPEEQPVADVTTQEMVRNAREGMAFEGNMAWFAVIAGFSRFIQETFPAG
jgi:hypothetical protein